MVPTELVLHWNKIHGVYSLDSVGQLIPFILGLGQLLDVLYRHYKKKPGDERTEDDEDGMTPLDALYGFLHTDDLYRTVPQAGTRGFTNVPDLAQSNI